MSPPRIGDRDAWTAARVELTRMGWKFPWFSSSPSEFNLDLGVSFTPEQQQHGGTYNFAHQEHPPGPTGSSSPCPVLD